MYGQQTWLRTGCTEGKAEKAERPVTVATVAGVRAFIVPKLREQRKAWKAKPRRGKGGRKIEARRPERSKPSDGSVRKS